jgi:HSP20 family protein
MFSTRTFFDPFEELRRVQREVNRLFGTFDQPSPSSLPLTGGSNDDKAALTGDQGAGTSGDASSAMQKHVGVGGGIGGSQLMAWAPRCDLSETDDAIKIKADLPGVGKENVKLEVDGDLLTLKGETQKEKREDNERYHRVERSYGSFSRSFRLPDYANLEGINASFNDGVLSVDIPKNPQAAPQHRQIDIK